MAYVVNVTDTPAANGATFAASLGVHVADDVLLVLANNDGGGTTIGLDATSTTAGWVMIGSQAASSGNRSAWAWKKASGAGTTGPVFTGATDDWVATALVIRGADTTSPIDGWQRTDWITVSSVGSNTGIGASSNAGAAITAPAKALLVYSWSADNNETMRCRLNDCIGVSKIDAANLSHIVGYKQIEASATVPVVTMYAKDAAEGGNGWVIAIKPATGSALQPMTRTSMDEICWYGTHGALHGVWDGAAFTALSITKPTDFAATINSIVCSAKNPTVATTTSSTETPWGTFHSLASTENVTLIESPGGSGAWVGGTHSINAGAGIDMTGKLFAVQWQHNAASNGARIGAEGILVAFSDGTNWAAYQIAKPTKGWLASANETAFIAVGNATTYATSGSIDWGAVTRLGFFWHRKTSSTTSDSMFIKNAVLLGTSSITGGGSSRPLKFSDMVPAMASWGHYKLSVLQGGSQVLAKSPIQIGDGTNITYFDAAASSLEFPVAWSATTTDNWQMDWNAGTNAVGLSIYANAGDTIGLSSGVAATTVANPLTIHASSTSGDVYSFSGESIVGYTPTDNVGLSWTGATFKSGGTVTIAGGGDMTNCTIASTTSANAALAITANGSTLDGCTIDGTGADYALELADGVTAITLTDCTLTAGSTDKVHVLDANGAHTVTITISGTTSLVAGDVTTAGATVYIAAPSPTLDATVLANTRAVLYNRTADAEISNTLVAGTSWTHTVTSGASSGDVLDLYTFKEGYQESVATIIYSGADATFAVQQAVDDAVDYYRTAESITDYTTLTEFNFYAPDIYIQSDDPDGATALKRLFIFYNGALTTEDGARYMRGGVTFRSAFDVVINRSAVALAVDNVSATLGLYFTDENVIRVTTDDGTSWIAPPSAPGSIRYAFGVSPGQIETGVSGLTGPESAQLMALPSASANATAVLSAATSAPIAADVKKMNAETVIGTGVEGDLWRGGV